MLHASPPACDRPPFALVLTCRLAACCLVTCCLVACGAAKPAQNAQNAPAPSSSASGSGTPSAVSATAADGNAASAGSPSPATGAAAASDNPGASSKAASASPARPTAATATEATSFIDDAITSRQKEIGHCVAEARKRRKNAHAEVVLEIGIDQEGKLIGVKSPKSASADPALNECVLGALKDAPFPRSKAGVITVKKNFSDQVVYP